MNLFFIGPLFKKEEELFAIPGSVPLTFPWNDLFFLDINTENTTHTVC